MGLTCFVSIFGTGHSRRGGSRLRIDGGGDTGTTRRGRLTQVGLRVGIL
jgi:hypothetical protein